MKMTFRWYGEGDSIPLSYIRQIPGMSGVVTAVYDVPVGEVWAEDKIARLKRLCDGAGLEMEVIESVPVHEDIKQGKPTRDKLIENYAQTIRNLGKYGVKCICYNFMPVFDWLRTDLKRKNADGSTSLCYCHDTLLKLDPKNLHLPGWDESYTTEELNGLFNLLRKHFLDCMKKICSRGVRLHILGDVSLLPDDVRALLKQAEADSAGYAGKGVNVALGYGSCARPIWRRKRAKG